MRGRKERGGVGGGRRGGEGREGGGRGEEWEGGRRGGERGGKWGGVGGKKLQGGLNDIHGMYQYTSPVILPYKTVTITITQYTHSSNAQWIEDTIPNTVTMVIEMYLK